MLSKAAIRGKRRHYNKAEKEREQWERKNEGNQHRTERKEENARKERQQA